MEMRLTKTQDFTNGPRGCSPRRRGAGNYNLSRRDRRYANRNADRLLRVLQEREFERVGDTQSITWEVGE